MPKFFTITEKHKVFEIYHLFYKLGKPFGFSWYSISTDDKQADKVNIYVTPFDLFGLAASLMYNSVMVSYHLHINRSLAPLNVDSGSIFNYGLKLSAIFCHAILNWSILIIFAGRNRLWKVSQTFQRVDMKVTKSRITLRIPIHILSIQYFNGKFLENERVETSFSARYSLYHLNFKC